MFSVQRFLRLLVHGLVSLRRLCRLLRLFRQNRSAQFTEHFSRRSNRMQVFEFPGEGHHMFFRPNELVLRHRSMSVAARVRARRHQIHHVARIPHLTTWSQVATCRTFVVRLRRILQITFELGEAQRTKRDTLALHLFETHKSPPCPIRAPHVMCIRTCREGPVPSWQSCSTKHSSHLRRHTPDPVLNPRNMTSLRNVFLETSGRRHCVSHQIPHKLSPQIRFQSPTLRLAPLTETSELVQQSSRPHDNLSNRTLSLPNHWLHKSELAVEIVLKRTNRIATIRARGPRPAKIGEKSFSWHSRTVPLRQLVLLDTSLTFDLRVCTYTVLTRRVKRSMRETMIFPKSIALPLTETW